LILPTIINIMVMVISRHNILPAVAAAVRTIGAIEAVGARSLLQLPKDCCYVDVAPDLL
jgi:hypothetical protein